MNRTLAQPGAGDAPETRTAAASQRQGGAQAAPAPLHRPWPGAWFLQRRGYVKFMLRELTALFVGIYLIVMLAFLHRMGQGEAAFGGLLASLTRPGWRVLHALALAAAVWHSITWFNLTPKAMPLRIGERRVPDAWVALAMGYLPWLVVTLLILLAILWR
jgi:fumarate reductase subunit C